MERHQILDFQLTNSNPKDIVKEKTRKSNGNSVMRETLIQIFKFFVMRV